MDLCFQDFESELATLPGKYSPPGGAILVAYSDNTLAGCVAMRALSPSICEMKRLWVREPFLGVGLGRALVRSILERARAAGYQRLRLDTLPQMEAARGLYRSFEFYPIQAYYENPVPGTIYLERRLDD